MNIRDQLALTREGVMILMDSPGRRAQFLVQVIYLAKIEDQADIVISDGLTWVKGKLKPRIKCDDIENLSKYDLVQIVGKDFEKSRDNLSFVLKNLKIFTSKIRRQLGKPVHYPDYYRKKAFIDIDDGNRFELDRFITLKEVRAMKAGRIKAAVLAKIVRIPKNIDKVMNILIEDQEDRMQCCFFYPEANHYHTALEQGKWYLFELPILQVNQCTNQIQIKIKRQSKIILANKQAQTLTDFQALIICRKSTSRSKSFSQKEKPIKQFSINHEYFKQQLVFIIARPISYFILRDGLGKVYQCVDRCGHTLEILLWSECNSKIEVGKTYRFDGLRVKSQKPKISLQSHKEMTNIGPSRLKLISKDEIDKGKTNKKEQRPSINISKPRELPKDVALTNLSYFVQRCEHQAIDTFVCYVNAYISLDSSLCSEYQSNYFHNFRRKIFCLDCNSCSSKGSRCSEDPIMVNDVMVCFDCKSKDIKVMWNIKGFLQDNHTVIQCRINNGISERLLNMTPMEGVLLYFNSPIILLDIINKKITFKRGIFKVSGKLKSGIIDNKDENNKGKTNRETKVIYDKNRRKEKVNQKEKEELVESEIKLQRFYYICENYAYNQRVVNDHVISELQRVEADFKLSLHPLPKQCGKIDTSNILTDAESYDYQDDC